MIEIAVHTALVATIGQIEMNAQRTPLAHCARDEPVHQGRGGDLRKATQRDAPPCGGSADMSNFLKDNSSKSERVSASAVSRVTSYCSTRSAARSSAVRRPSIFRQTKLPVSFSSCITLSPGEIMTVSSSISLQASAGFFCQTPLVATLMWAKPPKRIDSSGIAGCNLRFPHSPQREFATNDGDRGVPKKKTKHRAATILKAERAATFRRNFQSIGPDERFRIAVRSYLIPQRGTNPKMGCQMPATRRPLALGGKFRP